MRIEQAETAIVWSLSLKGNDSRRAQRCARLFCTFRCACLERFDLSVCEFTAAVIGAAAIWAGDQRAVSHA
jgi:hypothetical protein